MVRCLLIICSLQIRKKNNWMDLYLHKCLTKAAEFLAGVSRVNVEEIHLPCYYINADFRTYLDYSLTNILRKMNSQTVPKKGYVTDR